MTSFALVQNSGGRLEVMTGQFEEAEEFTVVERRFQGTPGELSKAQRFFGQATERNPNLALAYDALGEVYWFWAFFGFSPFRQACSTGIYYALRSLDIDNTLAGTHA